MPLNSLVVPGMRVIDGSEQQVDAERSLHASPQAFFSRERSFTEFSHLGGTAAERVIGSTFPALIDQRDGGPPRLPAGERLLRYTASNIAQLALRGGKRAVVESLTPMSRRTTSGRLAPIDLSLEAVGHSYVPVSTGVSVQIPKRLSEGVRTPADGVSLTPVDPAGRPLAGGEGALDGAGVVYANTQTATDTVAKPTSMGFELSAILRSISSPRRLLYRVGLPAGGSLVQARPGGPVGVLSGGRLIGAVRPPDAVDASGASVPVSMRVQGDLLSVSVEGAATQDQYPLDVDPEYYTGEDRSLTGGVFPVEEYKGGTNWKPIFTGAFSEATTYKESYSCGPEDWEWCDQSWYIEPTREYNGSEYVGLEYKTQGESTIYDLEMWVEGENEPSQTKTEVEYRYGPENKGRNNHVVLSEGMKQERYKYEPLSMTSGYFHNPLETPRGNDVKILDETAQHESSYGFWTWIWDARVYVAQEESEHPETESTSACPECGFNKSSATIVTSAGSRTNALYGSGSWLSPYQGAYEVTARDPGVGVSFAAVSGAGMSAERFIRDDEGKCAGIQCVQEYSTPMTYNEKMANGDDQIEWFAEDAAGLHGYSLATIKVDNSQPYNLGFTGMSEEGAEISASPRQLTVHATDGKKPTPSSGVRSIAVSIDGGKETVVSGASCPEGECTASGTYALNAEELSEGVHRLVVSAVSNSGVPASKEFLFDVRHASPVAVGPGDVDPITGNLTLGATDVALAGTGGVSRTYQSRNLTAGVGGPLGSQWTINEGGGESLKVLPTGSVVVLSSSGGQTTYSLSSEGEFQSPKGDENLKMEYRATEHKYVLSDTTAGAETVFEQPKGTESTAPAYGNQFGSELDQLNHPVSAAIDTRGNVWVADWSNDRIVEYSAEGVLLKAYGSYGSESGEMSEPWGIAINQKTGDIYVTDFGNDRIDEFSSSGAFVEAMGWGVNNGNAEYETCTSNCRSGLSGSGNGQFSMLEGVSVDSSGNIWVVDYGNNRIQEFNEAGKYLGQFGSTGSGAGQFNGPMNVAFAGGDMYITEENNNRIDEFSTAGSFIKTMGWGVSNGKEEAQTCTSSCRAGIAGAGNGQFNRPRGLAIDPVSGNLYVTEMGNNRVQEITTAGATVTKFGSGGSSSEQLALPMGVVVGSTGGIYVTDYEHSRVVEWLRSTWWPTSVKGALANHTTYVYTPVENSTGETSMYPYEVLSPPPSGVSCGSKSEELKMGCRALTFEYAKKTKESIGEKRSEWGEYKGRLSRVTFHGYNPSSKTMEEKAVAQYAYDAKGLLRAEWDPRMESSTDCGKTCSALKTTYGYDSEGHLTALTAPGQESWAFVYGTIGGDSNTGRLLKVTRSPASAPLWNGEAPEHTKTPELSGTPAVGVRMAVSSGLWRNGPVVYGYQWEDCNSEGKSCTTILGATDANYTPTSSDVGHTLLAQVTAINGGGSTIVSSLASAVVVSKAGSYTQTIDSGYSLNAISCIPSTTDCVVSDSQGRAFYATNVSSSAAASWNSWSGPGASPSEAVDCETSSLCLLAAGSDEGSGGNLYYATSLGGSWSEAYSPTRGVDAISCPSASFCVDGQDGSGSFRYSTNPPSTSWIGQNQGSAAMKSVTCLSSSFCAIADSKGDVHVATSTTQIKSSSWKETDVDGTTSLNGIACTSTSSCIAVDGVGDILNLAIESSGAATASKHDIDGSNSFSGVSCWASTCVAADSAGNVFVSENSGETWVKQYSLSEDLTSISCASASLCATVDTTGEVTALAPSGKASQGEGRSPEPGSTIEYRVPVSGSGAPYKLSNEEVEKWGQKDTSEREDNDPAEATALFPPDEPQGWPASDYTRATIDYINDKGLTVNTATPTGGISTNEYNELNEVVRSLSPSNRLTALNEGCISVPKKECRSAEVSEKLDTQTEYGPEGSEIVKVTGPEHKVKLSSGTEVDARAVTHNYYDADAKEAEEKNKEKYNLPTKSTTGALLSNGKEEDVRTTETSYSGQDDLGWKLRKPTSTTVDPKGLDLTNSTTYDENTGQVVETQTPAAHAEPASLLKSFSAFGGSGAGQLEKPGGVAVDSSGNVWVADTGHDRVQEFNSKGEFVREFGAEGKEAGEFSSPRGIAVSSAGGVYVADSGNNRVQEFNSKGEFVRAFGKEGSGNGEFYKVRGVAVDGEGHVWTVEAGYAGIFKSRVQEFSSEGAFIREFGSEGKEDGEFREPDGIAVDSKGDVWVADTGNNRVQEFRSTGEFVRAFGVEGTGNGQFNKPSGMAFDAEGDLWVADTGNDRVQRFTAEGSYLSQVGTAGRESGQFNKPEGIATNSSGKIVAADTGNNRVQVWTPEHRFAHDTKTVYYTSEKEARVAACQGHPEWANLPCRIEPAAQPADASKGQLELPITTMTYNIWDEVETATEKFGETPESVTRTKKETYDPAGRAVTSEEASTIDTPLPTVSNEYNIETGSLEKQSATIKGETKTTTTKDNTLGQLVEYADAEGNVAKYSYEEGSDGRLEEISEGKGEEAKSDQTYSYDPTTGFMTKLIDSAAGTFTASYNIEGQMTSEIYPNGMCANTIYNAIGQAVSLEYIKTRNCSESRPPVWFSDSVVPSVHGETLEQASTLSKENYAYDKAGRLTEVQETPAEHGCTISVYAYEEESNRTSLTTRTPTGEGKCASEGGTTQRHSYDEANRLTDEGVEYEAFGNTTKLPAADAGEHAITSTYYVDSQVATQEQHKILDSYVYDPLGRTMQTSSENTETKAKTTTVSHYAGPGSAVTWTSEGTEKWTRSIPGIDGSLSAIETSGGATVLQLHDLEGDIVATASLSESETKLLSVYNSTAFGVPQPGMTPPKYAWLGAVGVSSEPTQGSGTVTQGGASYVPQIARSLQTAGVIPPGAFPNGQPGTQYVPTISAGAAAAAAEKAKETFEKADSERQAAKQKEEEEQLRQCQAEGGCGAATGEYVSEFDEEDPYWVSKISVATANQLASEIYSAQGYLDVTKIGAVIKGTLGIDFIAQAEELIERSLFGFSQSEVEHWALGLATNLVECVADAAYGYMKPYNPHCWVEIPTSRDHVGISTPLGFVGFTVTIPNFADESVVQYCPHGSSNCYAT
ncbi:MAG: hypothetical protein WBQ21_07435 [Solirubrobacteraceae bacterium]